ncbi:hypothetical protein QF046_000307 [Microbacterium sp. W4I4]|uniref:hypothetical protein n=1 Tax=Microbacterium sp. W4I4 TaxID=3042295 RepID=UPI00278A40E4|nr:hypothetical protein [Microbacterium sp. W4I4]MDQ0612666.1 hypothetical protein [Microbacterium sp. W4I4]
MVVHEDHASLAAALRRSVVETGVLDAATRNSVLRTDPGEAVDRSSPAAVLARTIGEASFRVTDAQVDAVRAAMGSDKAAFEVVMSASVAAGLRRWDAAIAAIREASDAAG